MNCIYGSVNSHQAGDDPARDDGDITSPHLWGWYPEMLYDHLVWAGFEDIKFMPQQIIHPGPSFDSNFRCEATKPL
jgi:hypothetical protein